ncbi:MAG: response regulator transcription factor [Blastocatellia bacterium]
MGSKNKPAICFATAHASDRVSPFARINLTLPHPMSYRILIVDDDYDSCELMKIYLANEGFAATVASDGNEGIEVAVKEKPDLIITDAKMPNLNGIDMTKQLRSSSDFKRVPIIIVTGLGSGPQRAATEAGADEVLTKPVSPTFLVSRIKHLLGM